MSDRPIQDYYPDNVAICYGCGRNNPHGLHIQTMWEGTEGVCRFTPESHHTAFPGYVYGGLIASLIDCHSMGTAIAAAHQGAGLEPSLDSDLTYVTANLNVDYLKPTPAGVELFRKEPRGRQRFYFPRSDFEVDGTLPAPAL